LAYYYFLIFYLLIFEYMEEQFIQDDVEAGPSTRRDTHIPHSPVKVVDKRQATGKQR
jgi:uncharacterized membrane protein